MKKIRCDRRRLLSGVAIALVAAIGGSAVSHAHGKRDKTLELEKAGSFSIGGREVCAPGTFDPTVPGAGSRNTGQCFQIDHLYAQYQVPKDARKLPIVMIHGGAGTGRVWETTPDGRDGFQTIFVRRGFSVYVIDAPRGGRARSPTFNGPLGVLSDTENFIPSGTTSSVGSHQAFISWRLGASYPNFFPNSQFPQSGLKQFLQSIIPGIGISLPVNVDSTVALLDRIGPAILFTHSLSGVWGWDVVFRHPNVKGVVTFEGGYVFPPDAVPPTLPNCAGTQITQGTTTTAENFAKLTKIPILVMYGDNQPTCPEPNLIRDGHQLNPIKGQTFVDTLKSHGGKAEFIWLPKIGIRGNTHFIFMDKNNVQIADLVSRFLKKYGLDKARKGHDDDDDDHDH
jgi:pimeloyl-ACP methyl ester carboxylesterase